MLKHKYGEMSKLLLEILMITMLSSHPPENIASLRFEAVQVPLHQFVSFALVLSEFYLVLFLKFFFSAAGVFLRIITDSNNTENYGNWADN